MRMKGKSWIIVCVVLLIIGLLLFLFRDKILGKNKDAGTAGTGSDAAVPEFPLAVGSRGEKVRKLQAYLNQMFSLAPVSRDYMPLVEDGIFGTKTEAACQMFLNTSSVSETWYNQNIK